MERLGERHPPVDLASADYTTRNAAALRRRFGGPLEYMARMVRVLRIVEGPSEVHRWTIARDLLKNGLPT